MTHRHLINAPARLSDLHGDARTRALVARHRASTEAWLRDRARPSLWARIVGVLRRG